MFDATLKAIRDGKLNLEAEERLREVIAAVQATGKAGKLTLTLIVKPATKGDTNALVVADQTKVTLPQAGAGETVLFATKDGGLSRRDQRQPELVGLREIKGHTPLAGRVDEHQEGVANA